jgi:multiple sugar transport system permease protein
MNKIKELWTKLVDYVKFVIQKRRRIEKVVTQLVVYALLITVSYVFLFPLFSMVSLSFMSPTDIINPEVDFIPRSIYFGNFLASWAVLDGFTSLFNSVWFSFSLAFGQTLVSAMTGYAFARYNFIFKKFLFVLILISFIVPVPVILIPRIMMIVAAQDTIGYTLMGTVIPQMVFSIFGQGVNSAILILIFYNFFRLIPNALYEAAKIDGAGALDQFWHITVKMSASTIIVVFLFSFVWNWNETYVTGLLVGDGITLMPMQLGVFDSLFQQRPPDIPGQGGSARISEAYKMSATLITMIPLFIIYAFAQRQFIEGIENTGITGE